jgi:chemotaxis protein methyltransferase CheR
LGRGPALITAREPGWAELKRRIIARTGHAYYEDRDPRLLAIVQERMDALGTSTLQVYSSLLADPDHREWSRLESATTINETFFFRFGEQFEALRKAILPGLIERRASVRRLRIWSAGCSTGAEPFSLAMVLRDLLGEAIDGWSISITGTDIDEEALRQAREGVFGAWALRVVTPEERDRLFTPDGPRWRVRPQYRALCRFERFNLLDLVGTAPLQFTGYDLILCRNVLIYFSPDLATQIANRLVERLQPDGALLLGHAESGLAADAGRVEDLGGALVHLPRPARAAEVPPTLPVPAGRTDGAPAGVPGGRAPERIPSPTPDATPGPDLDPIRRTLDRGDLAEARRLAAAAAAAAPQDASPLYLLALADMASGDMASAERGFGRVLYLDPQHVLAHYMEGVVRFDRGDTVAARRSLRNALAATAGVDGAGELRDGEGMTAGDITMAIRARLSPGWPT